MSAIRNNPQVYDLRLLLARWDADMVRGLRAKCSHDFSTQAQGLEHMADGTTPEGSTTIAQGQLRSFVERIERLEEEKAALAADIKEVYAEAKGNGFDTKTLRKVISLRKKDTAERQEEEAMLELYLHALGMLN